MSTWAMWGTLPAGGLGKRDPLRPYATGGIGAAVFIFVPGPEGEIIVIYGTPTLEFVETMIPEITHAESGVVEVDLTWVRTLQNVATLIHATTPRMVNLITAQSVPAAIYRIVGPYAPQVAAGTIYGALTGAEVPQTDSDLELADSLQAEITGAFNTDYDAELYAASVLSSQES